MRHRVRFCLTSGRIILGILADFPRRGLRTAPRRGRKSSGGRLLPVSSSSGNPEESSRRRGDRARSLMPQHAARGAGSRARRRLEPPLCRPPARRRAVNRHLHCAFTQGARPPRASTRCPAPSRPGEPFNFSRQAITNKNHRRRDSVGLRPPRDSEIGCGDRLLRPAISWVSGFYIRCSLLLSKCDICEPPSPSSPPRILIVY